MAALDPTPPSRQGHDTQPSTRPGSTPGSPFEDHRFEVQSSGSTASTVSGYTSSRPSPPSVIVTPSRDELERHASARSERTVTGYPSSWPGPPGPPSGNMTPSANALERIASARSERTVSGYEPNDRNHSRSQPHRRSNSLVTVPRDPGATSRPSAHGNEEAPDRSLRRALHNYHIFFIAISAVIGMGYYVRTGTLLHIGGQAAVVYTYAFLGLLAFMVLRGLTTMLRIWPIGGALIVFVEEFVDKDVANSVAIIYWLTYCFSCASLTTTIGNLMDSSNFNPSKATSVGISVIFVLLPILANLTDIQVFRQIELFMGSLKLALALVLILMMNIINPSIGDQPPVLSSTLDSRDVVFQLSGTPGGWFAALLTSIFLGSFSFVGIEVIAATAEEAKFKPSPHPPPDASPQPPPPVGAPPTQVDHAPPRLPPNRSVTDSVLLDTTTDNPFEYAIWVPVAATFIYLWGGWMVSHNIAWNDSRLPGLGSGSHQSSGSIFVTSGGMYSGVMEQAVTVLLMLNVASTSSSALYVASRTLFGFAYNTAKAGKQNSRFAWYFEMMCRLSVKSKFDVPYRAVFASSWLFWLPFLKYSKSPDLYLNAITVLSEMASVSCILVWAFESLAAFRFYKFLKNGSRDYPVLASRLKLIARVDDPAWYYGHRTMSALSVALCFTVIIVGGAMALLSDVSVQQGLGVFLIIPIFLVATVFPKVFGPRGKDYKWPVLKLGVLLKFENFDEIVRRLNNHLKHNTDGTYPAKDMKVWDFFGIIDSVWLVKKVNGWL